METTVCRRCTECQDRSHHWMVDLLEPMCDEDESTIEQGMFGCKHCDQRGDECPDCGGDGCGPANEHDFSDQPDNCLTCGGEGVVPLGHPSLAPGLR